MNLTSESGVLKVIFQKNDVIILWCIFIIALLALVVAFQFLKEVLSANEGSKSMQEIAKTIQQGAKAFLHRQFKTLGIFVIVLGVLLFFILPVSQDAINNGMELPLKFGRSIAFIIGAAFSAITGYTGMWLAVRANVRTAQAAKESGIKQAMKISFRAGGVAGLFTVGLGLLGAVSIIIIFKEYASVVLVGFGFGGALLAMFMRVGGGIFTKAADVGADLVGKVEKNIPEDDIRNPATIADNVGDNVGDCAGMAADLFESYEVTLVAALILGVAAFRSDNPATAVIGIMFPLLVRAIGVITSIIGVLAVTPNKNDQHGMSSINRGFFLSEIVSFIAIVITSYIFIGGSSWWRPAIAVLLGLILAAVIQLLTQYFTDFNYKPVRSVARSTKTGPATTILTGFSVGLESSVWSVIIIGLTILGATCLVEPGLEPSQYVATALYYIALAGMGMLTTVGVIVSMDTFGPISDNAQGIAEMSGEFKGDAAKTLNNLDAVGNSTKAITKGIAIATAVIAATSMFGSFAETILESAGSKVIAGVDTIVTNNMAAQKFIVDVSIPNVLVGLLFGGAVAYLFSTLSIEAVANAASEIVMEVRSQFKNHPKIMEYKEKPNYAKVVDICTKRSLKELMTPGILAILSPIIVGFALGPAALGGFLAGTILTGQLLAVMFSNSGGAWDNAKKLIEDGHYGGKGSPEHKASIIGDTVGDPFKDTAGPSLNPLIKVMNLVSVLAAGAIVQYYDSSLIRTSVVIICLVILAVLIIRSKKNSGFSLEN
jgi:K(+)-stimulated pyrophosphate-energized sodium pump